MARRWRLRHKLMLGLALVLGSIVLLMVGAVRGLTDFVTTAHATESRVTELMFAQQLKLSVGDMFGHVHGQVSGNGIIRDRSALQGKLDAVRKTFTGYSEAYALTLERGRDADPILETAYIADISTLLDRIHDLLDKRAGDVHVGTQSQPIADDELRGVHAELSRVVDHLLMEIIEDIYQGFHDTRVGYRWSMGTVIAACVLGVLLTLLMIYLFRRWVFRPIQVIQRGVHRVSNADFDSPIRLESGDELQELGDAFNEMTDRLRTIYRDLAQQVNDRSRQLVRSERMVSVGFLAAGVAHEINNPLASIAFCSEALERRVRDMTHDGSKDADDLRKYLSMIQQEAFRCKEITGRLLEFSRAGERKRELTDVAELIQNVLEIARHLQNCRGKHLVFRPLTRPVAPLNAPDLKSVVLNLVVNALDSMETGGTVTIELRDADGFAEMTVSDTGCGMAPEVLENIFEPFFTRSRTGKGTGLGLFISHQIIDQHGGQIEASSAGPGRGSTFTVRLPLTRVDRDTLPLEQTWARGDRTPRPVSDVTEDGLGNAAA